MEIIAKCPTCDAGLPVSGLDALDSIKCGRCGHLLSLAFSPAVREGRAVDSCPVCSGPDFYTRKDFNPELGLAIIIAGALVSAGFYWLDLDFVAYAVLAAAVLLDLVVYHRLGEVTICYRCHSEFRGGYPHPAPRFDLHTADALEQEYARRIGRQ